MTNNLQNGLRTCLVLFCALAWGASLLRAQTFGEITGTVTDASGAIVVGASVTAAHVSTNQIRRAETNQTGNYTIPFLAPGIYDVQAETTGFKVATRKGVDLQVGTVARINFALELGDVTQHVEVVGGAPLLTTESTALGTVIENKRIVELPLNGRNYLQLVALSPNVTTEGGAGGGGGLQGGERTQQAFSIAGQRLEFNRYTLDGVENTDANFNSYVIRPSIDALQEFKVQSGVYSAEYGRQTSQINVTTKSGSNAFHGSVFEFLRNSALDAKEWRQTSQKNPFRRNQFGFTLGGRLIRDKLFFLSNFEALRDRKTLEQTASVATDKMRAGDFSGQSRAIFDPLTRVFTTDAQGNARATSATRFPNNAMPQGRFNPISLKLFEFYPKATVPGDNILRNYVRQAPRPISTEQFIQRIDWNESARSSWFGRYSWGDEYAGDVTTFAQAAGRVETRVKQAVLSNTRTFGTTTVNEFRLGYNQFQNDKVGHFSNIRDVASELGIVGLVPTNPAAWGFPIIGLADGLTGFSEADPWVTRDHTFQWMDNVAINRGRHALKFGGEIRRDRYNQFGNQKAKGEFLFTGFATFDPANRNATGHSFADYLLGEISDNQRALGIANALLRSSAYYLYFQDDWKITSRLTLNAGLRYENTRPWHDKYRGIMNLQLFDPGVGPQGLLPSTRVPITTRPGDGDFYEGLPFHFHDGVPIQTGDGPMGHSLVAPDNNDFAPRLGLAYSPTNRWTLRTGFGVFYAKDTGNPVFDMGRNLAGAGGITADHERPNSNLSDPWKFQRETFRCSNWSGPCLGPPQALANIYGRRTPYVLQWLFNVQRQLSQNLLLEVGYQGNAGHKLERLRHLNQAVEKKGLNDATPLAQRQPWPAYERLQFVDGSVNSNYHALSGKLQQRFSKGLTYLVGYTWSKAIDLGSAIRTNSGDRLVCMNCYDLTRERGLSQFHVGRRLVGSFLYELPFGVGRAFANGAVLDKFVGGWQVGSILTFADGSPINVTRLGDTNNVGTNENYPDATGISPFPKNQTVDQFWDIAAFDPRNPELSYRFGTVGSRVLRKPGTRQWDFSVLKNTSIREGHSLQFRFEAFNAGNHPNWNTPSTSSTTPATFGRITTARTMRELQFGLKYVF